MLCSSTRNRRSNARCSHKALNGLLFCGKHLKSKNKILWKPETLHVDSATKIQAAWRGRMVRLMLTLAGDPFDRSRCHNEEELVTLEEKGKQHPLNYFSFSENGKVWWFAIDTMFKLMQDAIPVNPYTKQPFTRETRIRIREIHELWWYRQQIKLSETLHDKAIALTHILEEQLFETVSHVRLEFMSRLSILCVSECIHHHLEARVIQSPSSIRRKHLFIIESCIHRQFMIDEDNEFLLFQLLSTLLYILRTTKNKFPLSFIIFGALQGM